MSFTSYTYFAFLAVAVLLVRWVRGATREYVLLAASLVFYAAWDPRFLLVLLALGAATYLAGNQIRRHPRDFRWLIWPVLAIVAVLSVFKYSAMVVGLLNLGLPDRWRLHLPHVILPLGISFYTFECISYLLDIYKGGRGMEPFHRFLLFPAFWPHLVAGPILRTKEFAPQFETLRTASGSEIVSGADRMLIGLLKKVVFANSLGTFVDQGFASMRNSAADCWILALAFGLQIYFDFSAYTDIAIGSARMVGFKLPENFNLPYHTKNPTDFWNRWHITLSRWIRDYLFFPLNLKAGRRIWMRYLYLIAVMAVVGLWHGAGLGFVLWGVWHGILMTGHRLLQGPAKRLTRRGLTMARAAGAVVTFALVNAGWVLFRAANIRQSAPMLWRMFTVRGLGLAYSVNDYLFLIFALGVYFLLEPLLKRVGDRSPHEVAAERAVFWFRPAFYGLAILLLFMFDRSNTAFIYFQF